MTGKLFLVKKGNRKKRIPTLLAGGTNRLKVRQNPSSSRMSGNPQKRFEQIMQKLSQSTPPLRNKKPSSSITPSSGAIRVWKNNNSTGSNGLIKNCRPWDRGDFLKRLSTFKAMTWFGKPKVINPVNCARRGWINTDVDVIVCEACGARLLFTTPSSWSLQQVGKAAAVFSLKLDNGHKMLCPWINNTCDEKLALFPPTPPLALVDSYIERSTALLRLTALPVISSFAIDYMNSPQLEQFLLKSSLPVNLSDGISLIDNHRNKVLEGVEEDASANAYYKAQKIISLCGWEPCLLPYAVNSESETSKHSEETNNEETNQCIINTTDSVENEKVRSNNSSVGENQYDMSSVTLDCKLCGARVGLWAFKAVQRPLESFTVIAESNGHAESADGNSNKEDQNVSTSPGLKLTIAGGPLPTKQNFRPVVSFPIISRHFRAKWTYNSDFTDTSLKRKRADDETIVSENNNLNNIAQNGSEIENIGAEGRNMPTEKVVNEEANKVAADLDHANLTSNHNNQESSDITSNSADRCKETEEDHINSSNNNDDSTTNGVEITPLSLVNAKEISNCGLGYTRMQPSHNCRIDEFNPVKQHRPFCPWIAPESGDSLPGWKLTLNALTQLAKASSDTQHVSSSKSNDEVDDTLVSIRKLFMSPPAKRFKDAR